MTSLNITRTNDYEIVQLDSGKVNAIDTEMVSDLLAYFTQAAQDDAIRGVILTGRPNCFSAGINIKKLFLGGDDGYREFWINYYGAVQAMANFHKPLICAISGYAPAGACILTATTDYRIMAIGEKHKIGMHEVSLSLQIPEMFLRLYAYWLGQRKALNFVMNSRLFSAEEAVAIGLVDEACAVEDVLPRAEAVMQRWLTSHDTILQRTKQYLRADLRAIVNVDFEPMIAEGLGDLQDATLVAKQTAFLQALGGR